MKDFRDRIVLRSPERGEVAEVLHQGHIAKALRKARAAGVVIQQEDIDVTARKMFRAGRASELLALIGTVDVKLPYEVPMLLRRAFEVGDYHGFLKQAHRLGAAAGFESQIVEAIAAIGRRVPIEASSWRRKFAVG
jgi:hypothetical protein